jgi:hypothetical protein
MPKRYTHPLAARPGFECKQELESRTGVAAVVSRWLLTRLSLGLHARGVAWGTLSIVSSDSFVASTARLDCFYRVERTGSRAGVAPAEVQRHSRRTF